MLRWAGEGGPRARRAAPQGGVPRWQKDGEERGAGIWGKNKGVQAQTWGSEGESEAEPAWMEKRAAHLAQQRP